MSTGPIILDGVLPEAMEKEIEDVLLGFRFPWFYYPNTNDRALSTQQGDAPQFVHGFIQDGKPFSEWAGLAESVVARLGLDKRDIIRAKANMLGRERQPLTHPPHTDDEAPHWVMIYYVNNADGDTCLFEDGAVTGRITPKRGRFAIFDGRREHASSSPVEAPFRGILNFNLRKTVPAALLAGLREKAR
jgi:hypothetical protein